MGLASRPVIGMKDVVYAVLDEATDILNGTPSFGTIYPLAGALEMSFDPGSSSASLFADDGLAEAAETVGEMKVTLGVKDVLPADIARLLGHSYVGGAIVDNVSDVSPYVAIGFKRQRSGKDGANNVFEYAWLLKVKFSKPKADGKTKGSSIEFQTPSLEGLVCKLQANGNYRVRVRTDDPAAPAAYLTGFFSQPVIAASADLGALACAIAKNSTNMTFTFTKAGGGNVTIDSALLTSANLPVLKGASAAPLAGTYGASGQGTATVVVTFTPSVAFGTAYVAGYCGAGIVDQNGVKATPAGAVISYP